MGCRSFMGLGCMCLAGVSFAAPSGPPSGTGAQSEVLDAGPSLGIDAPLGFGQPGRVSFRAPTKDTFTYPNIGSAGNTRLFAWLSYFPTEGRMSNMLAMFDTGGAGAPTGDAARRTIITGMRATIASNISGRRTDYDPDSDPWQSILWPGGDVLVFNEPGGFQVVGSVAVGADPRAIPQGGAETDNKPVEMFAAGFRNGTSAATWDESSLGTPGFDNTTLTFNAYAMDFGDDGVARDVTNSFGQTAIEYTFGPFVGDDQQTYMTDYPTGALLPNPQDGFDAVPLALGQSVGIPAANDGQTPFGQGQAALALGDEIPFGHRLVFEVDTSLPGVQQHFRDSLEAGWVSLMFSHIAFGDHGTSQYGYWLTKEGSDALPASVNLDATTLEIDYLVLSGGDLSGNGRVGPEDVSAFLEYWSNADSYAYAHPHLDAEALADLNADGAVTPADFVALLDLVREVGR